MVSTQWAPIQLTSLNESWSFIMRVIMFRIQCGQWTLREAWQQCGCLTKIKCGSNFVRQHGVIMMVDHEFDG